MRISDWSSDVCSSDLRTPVPLQAVIFDLDGVLTDTARVHYVAWKQLADSLDIEFNETINRRLKGVDRRGSLDIMLERSARTFSAPDKLAYCERKNARHHMQLDNLRPKGVFQGAAHVRATYGHTGP